MAFALSAAAAGVAAGAAYLDGKYNIREDLANLKEQRHVRTLTKSRAKPNRRSLWYKFEEQTRTRPSQDLCIWYRPIPSQPPIELTWTQVYDNCCRWAQFLLHNGVQQGEMIGSYLQNSPEFMYTLLGSWAFGGATAMINYNLAGDSLVHCLKIAGCKTVIVDEDADCMSRIEEERYRLETELGIRIIVLDNATRDAVNAMEPIRLDNSYRDTVLPETPMFLFYTSGTTGMPKACAFQADRSYVMGDPRLRSTGMVPGDRWYNCMPLYHGTGCSVACCAIMSGLGLAIGRKFSVRNFWKDIHDSEANAFVYVGETARYLLAAPPSPYDKDHNLKAMFGNGLRPDIWRRFQERFAVPRINEFFNSTEGVFTLMNVAQGSHRVGSVGFHGGLNRWLYKNYYVPVAIDQETGDIWRDPKTGFAKRTSYEDGGEIIVQIANEKVFCGYWGNPEATEKKFVRNVFSKGDLFFRSGDALRRDSEGRWFFMDRLGDTFRWKSENVSTAEVAEVLGQFPGLVEANVYGVEVPAHDGRAGCSTLFINPQDRPAFDYQALLAHARKTLPKYAVPVFLRVIENPTPSHTNKQNKAPFRKEGIDLAKIRNGDIGPEDTMLWARPGSSTYEPFDEESWHGLVNGSIKI
ncbi:acetyl-CoA synthetase-like protein [Polychaeton citri CBS 116435]|uniref:Very long-chain fatty acid transport protein n=1 Tax=Polychaeton citri CBS 116435 TaxID=1314669 RepID=A0A9P4PYS8_9PEZI|nr:acetyl-CoA synthetase-like protein [Polychaeton citri CBS 116435]